MSEEGLKKGIVQILVANIINLIFGIGTGFLLPKYLSVESYSQIKTYQLYITYVAILHFGYNDGMYLKYGGKSICEIGHRSIEKDLSTLRIFQFVMMLFGICLALFLRDIPLLMAAIAVLPQNIIAYFKNLYQAVGQFKRYSKIMNFTTGITFAINMVLIAIVKTDNYILYLVGYVALSATLWIILEHNLHHNGDIKLCVTSFSFTALKENISGGILLLLGNFSSQLLTSLDRWFVKFLIGSLAFAQYAFAVSMENFLNVAVTPISVTLYNYFCKNNNDEQVLKIRELIIAFATIIVAAAFPVKFILETFLQKYLVSTIVIFLLFAAQVFYIIIKSIYVNLYKARKMQKQYFSKLCIIIVIAFLFNVVCYIAYPVKEAFAIGTLLSAIVWFFLSQFDFKNLKYLRRHYVYLTVEIAVFIFCGCTFSAIIGGVIYLATTIVMLYVCMPGALQKFFGIVRPVVKSVFTPHKR